MRPIRRILIRQAHLAIVLLIAGLLLAGCSFTVPRLRYTPPSPSSAISLLLPAEGQPSIIVGPVTDTRGVDERFLEEAGDTYLLPVPLADEVKKFLIAELKRLRVLVTSQASEAKGRLEAEVTRFRIRFKSFGGSTATFSIRVKLVAAGATRPIWEANLQGSGSTAGMVGTGPISQVTSRALSKAVAGLGQAPGFADTLAKLSGAARAVAKRETPPRRPEAVARPAAPETKAWRSAGSGFLLRGTTHILTSLHVVQGMKTIRVSFPTGETYPTKIVAGDANNDLALLQVQGMQAKAGGFAADLGTEVEPGERVHALGCPLGAQLSRRPSIVSGEVSAATGLGDNIAQFRMTNPINEGNSGGPVINSRGLLVGVAASGMIQRGVQGIRFGTKISVAMLILRRARLARKFSIAVVPKGRLTAVEIFRENSPFVVLIETR